MKISSFNHIAEHMNPLGDNSGQSDTSPGPGLQVISCILLASTLGSGAFRSLKPFSAPGWYRYKKTGCSLHLFFPVAIFEL